MERNDLLARFEEHIVRVGLAPATIANYLADIQNFVSWCEKPETGQASLLSPSSEHVRRYCQFLQRQGRSTSTVNRRLQAVRKFYDFVAHIGLSSHNPARDVERIRERSSSSPRVLATEEVNKLLGAVRKGTDSLQRRDRAILLVLLDTGIKVRELVDLRMDDLDLNVGNGYIWVGMDLQSGGRCLTIGSETCAALRAYMRIRVSVPGVKHVFVSRQGLALSVRTVQRLVSNYARAVGLEGVSAQTLRSTFAHDALEGRDLAEVARMLGLRDVAGVRRYLG